MFTYLQHMFNFLHLQENLLYVQGDRPISPDLMYHIMSANSVFIRSTYSLDDHTLLVDLNVPTGELDFDLTLDIITACQQYQWKYKGDTLWKHLRLMIYCKILESFKIILFI